MMGTQMKWWISNHSDPEPRSIADRHYSRQKPGSRQFTPPGRLLVLKTQPIDAYWVTLWQLPELIKHDWPEAFVCSAFRNEGSHLSSDLILEALAATRWKYPNIPSMGMITFVDIDKVKDGNPGYCFQCAGFMKVGYTKGGLRVLQLLPEDFLKHRRQ